MIFQTAITNITKKIQEFLGLTKTYDAFREEYQGNEQESTDWKQDNYGYWTRLGWVLMLKDGGMLRYDEWGGSTPKPGEAKVFLTAKDAIEYKIQNRMKAYLHFATLSVKDEGEIGGRRDKMVVLYPSFVKALKAAKVAIVQDGPGVNSRVALVEIENLLAKAKD